MEVILAIIMLAIIGWVVYRVVILPAMEANAERKTKSKLKEKVRSLGKLEGMKLGEFEKVCGKANFSKSIVGQGVYEHTWQNMEYKIILRVDAFDNTIKSVVREEESTTRKYGLIALYTGIAILAILFIYISASEGISQSKSKKTSYYDLSPQEQENAKWAYEAQQAIGEIEGND